MRGKKASKFAGHGCDIVRDQDATFGGGNPQQLAVGRAVF